MPDPFTPLFADLRDDVIRQVQAPGAAAAHRRVRRRRVATSSAAAMVLAAAATFAVVRYDGHDDDGVLPAASPSDAMATSVWRAAGLVPDPNHVGLVAQQSQPVITDVEKGRYRLRVACSGQVPLPLEIVLTGGRVERADTIACAEAGVVRDYEITLPRPGVVMVRFGIEAQADAYAIKLTQI